MDDGVEETVFEQEFGALEAFGELLPDWLAGGGGGRQTGGAGRFADVEVPEHREAGGDAAGGGIGEHGDVRQLFVVETSQRGGNFSELHEADGACHHAR